MSGERVERRLAAILAVDVAGYSRLMGQDEEGTLAALRAVRRELGDPKITEHRGRIVKTSGDGLLVEFASVVDAVRCAVEVQREMAARNAAVPVARRIEFRMGVNVGDIIIEDGDIFGDGVNIAARLEALAEPGGICISAAAHEQVRDRLDIAFDDLGERQVKNITRPVRTYRIALDATSRAALPAGAPLPLPDKPSIAVLPFQNMSGDPEQEYFVDGMVEDIITGLSRIKWLFVIARNSTFVYKGRAVDVKQVGRDLGVRYILEGSVRKLGNRVRITSQLIDAANAAHVWAERYDRTLDDIFALQDELTMSVIGAVEPSLLKVEIERARRKRPDSLDAYDLYLRALPLATTGMPENADNALPLLVQAIALEPDYAAAHGMIAWCHEQRYLRGGLREETRTAASNHARAAIAMGGDDAPALALGGFVLGVVEHDFASALSAIDRSLALSPSSALTYAFSAIIRAWKGDDADAVAHAETALRHSPYDPLMWMPYVGLAYTHFFSGRFADALGAAVRTLRGNPRFSVPAFLQAASLAQLGRDTEAAAAGRNLLELQPGFTIASLVDSAFTSPERLAMLAEALRKAGLPE
jgi:adenylate cyclase